MKYTLGLDMGVASLGWAVISEDKQFIDSGVRIFPAGIDKFGTGKDTHLNQERRKARGARRRVTRKAKRRIMIRELLTQLGWIPSDPNHLQDWENLDIYQLRSRALTEKITLQEFARIILHLNQRRGFLSLRKSELDAAEGEEKKTLEGMKGEMESLQASIESTFNDPKERTLGNYLHHLRQKNGGAHGNLIRLRSRHIRRDMLHHEFSLIWEEQSRHHSELTDALRYGSHGKQKNPTVVVKPIPRKKEETILQQFGLENLTFFQRRVYWPTSSIGKCELEKGELRAPIADRRFQEFRMLSELNNLRLIDSSVDGKPAERKFTPPERKLALAYVSSTQKPTLKSLKSKIAKLPDSPPLSQITFNLEQGKRDNLGGLQTDLKLAKAFGAADWANLPESDKNRIVEILTMPEPGATKVIQRTDDETKELLLQLPNLTESQIESLLRVALPAGYCGLSIKALEKLLPHIRAGFNYQGKTEEDSALHLAGYERRDETANRLLDKLPLLSELTNPNSKVHDPNFPHVNNPLVLRSLHELRKVVNGVISKHGPPAQIHLEMARDLKMSAKQRDEHAKKNNDHKKSRDQAATKLEENGIAPTRDAILLYRLWEEQEGCCIYSGTPISFKQLVSGEVDIDHIYPRRANDDSYMNKVVCFAQENREKGDRLPMDWLGETSDKFQALTKRVEILPYGKRKRLLAEKLPDGFAARDATDTAYMTRVARHYLTYLVEKDHHVFCTKGKHTAFLRKQWGLNSLLRHDLLDLKNREDHRHHALDAIVIAACSPSLLQKISKELTFENKWREKACDDGIKRRIYRLKPVADTITPPWPTFAQDAESSLNSIWVSHRPNRKVSGPLHEETNYGPTATPGVLVRRKNISSLKDTELKKIRDPEVARAVTTYLAREKRLYRSDIGGKSFKDELDALFSNRESLVQSDIDLIDDKKLRTTLTAKLTKKNPLQDADLGKITLPSGIPIKKARLLIANKTAIPLRARQPKELLIPGNTHHLAIFSLGDGKFHFEPVTLLEATRRKRAKLPIIDKTPPKDQPEAEFLMHLCSGDLISTVDGDSTKLFVFSTIAATIGQARFVEHTDARDSKTRKLFTAGPGSFAKNFPNAQKVEIWPSGELRPSS
ncbi:MAG: type II CRISPR RNA-guided endonuclease Cas9 [Verrucomicrobiaceae bacterium]